MLGWQPLFTLDEGLRRTVKWYEDFFGVLQTGGKSANV
jgi:dTDP-D-glucose 4,6-dehydratase